MTCGHWTAVPNALVLKWLRQMPTQPGMRTLDGDFREQITRCGVMTTYAVALSSLAYVVMTWSSPARPAITAIIALAIVEATVIAWVSRSRSTADALGEPFLALWNCGHVVTAGVLCHLDGGLGSPFVFIFFLSVAFAGGALRSALVVRVAALDVAVVATVAAVHAGSTREQGVAVMWAGGLVVLAGVSTTIAQHRTRSVTALRQAKEEVARRLARVVEYRDDDTGGHIERMAEYAMLIGRAMDLDDHACRELRFAATMHDIGKVAVPDAILLKPGKLTAEERTVMETHARVGHEMLGGSGSELLDLAATIALTHHERWDGAGYPCGLAAEAIPLPGRIVAVADVFDAVTSKRVYKDAVEVERAIAIIEDGSGTQFDPDVVRAFVRAVDEIKAARARCTDPEPRPALDLPRALRDEGPKPAGALALA